MQVSQDQTLIETAIGGGLFPFGYAASLDHRVEHLMQTMPQAVLLDIRLRARSRWYSHWNKSALQKRWGFRYVHEMRLGNVHYQYVDRPIELLDPEAALPWVMERLQQGTVFLLFCACRDYERCHRKVVIELLLQRCLEKRRAPGMRFAVERGAYVGVCHRVDFVSNRYVDLSGVDPLEDGEAQVCVAAPIFEQYRLCTDPVVLHDVQFWVAMVYEHPGVVVLEATPLGGSYGV